MRSGSFGRLLPGSQAAGAPDSRAASSVGSDEFNQTLSERRAGRVRRQGFDYAEVALPLRTDGSFLLLFSAQLDDTLRSIDLIRKSLLVSGALALAIFDDIQLGDTRHALWLVALTVVIAFALLVWTERLLRAPARNAEAA